MNFEHKLYLAVTDEVFEKFNDKPAILEFIAESELYLIIFNSETEEILQWIDQKNIAKYLNP